MSWAEIARAGRWSEWTGLPELTEAELRAGLGLALGTRASVRLGRERLELVTCGPTRYWLDGDQVRLVELVEPASPPAVELLAALGPASREGPGRHRRLDSSTDEHVYPERGLAVTVAHTFDDAPPFVAQVLLFAPTDLTGFVVELGGNDRAGPAY